MRFVILTGLSGAGKTQTIRNLEDLGFFCPVGTLLVDSANMPHPVRLGFSVLNPVLNGSGS